MPDTVYGPVGDAEVGSTVRLICHIWDEDAGDYTSQAWAAFETYEDGIKYILANPDSDQAAEFVIEEGNDHGMFLKETSTGLYLRWIGQWVILDEFPHGVGSQEHEAEGYEGETRPFHLWLQGAGNWAVCRQENGYLNVKESGPHCLVTYELV